MQQQVCFSDISNSRLSQNGRRDSVKFGTPVVLLGSASLQLSMTCCSLFELTKQTLNNMQPIPTTKNIKKYICRCVTSAVGAAPACLYSSIRLPFPWRGVRRWVHLQLFQALAQILHSNGFVQSTVDGSEIRLTS